MAKGGEIVVMIGRFFGGCGNSESAVKFIVFLFLSCVGFQAYGLEISNFKSGPMCGINMDDMGWVCFEDEEIHVTGQSSCWWPVTCGQVARLCKGEGVRPMQA